MENRKYVEFSLEEFSNEVAAKKTMPGGGSVAAYCASLSAALASMVGNFTVGKKKYQQYDEDVKEIIEKAKEYEKISLDLVDEDVKAYLPLSNAYKLPSDTEEEKKLKQLTIQDCLKVAASVPLKTLQISNEILKLHEELLVKGSNMLISDVGVGVMMLKASVLSAKLNILINIKYIDDENFVNEYKLELESLEKKICDSCDRIYQSVVEKLI
ncbi:MAG: cyclodeaminase/cyclohydrolase family protein [Peptostreptococcus porci]|uniref:cyclodeaminase/cyclohydrolase family protein n=1 Tax=Peptostreptococcus porci TaxID=2652282 RepID=UPI002A754152|nr:cyclodeaminase/cyclohydrolase family protein [Peptostreptococcus porci]MDY2794779.1 cyclodeaminase/cyclohydrolase family protein [Peptostreptococcus porci]MDY4561337.1 cyclodeaminase/cyclohydrolase family protein [Peptostreptococcus porci]MDY5479972.1 cyclodeaminase/cyclohydrolase family protein [Peptostreptococcus porci]